MPLLRVIVGPDVGATAEVDESPVTIGRGDECQLKMTDKHVSIVHAIVEPCERGYRLRDLESSGGTTVNGQRVLERHLLFGDVIRLGESLILFGSGDATVDSETVGSAESPRPGGSEFSDQ